MISCLRHKRGITLFELLTCLSTVSILLALAFPSLTQLQTALQNAAAVKILRQSIGIARAQAITSRSFVTLCRSEDGRSCGGRWEQGVLIFTDKDGDRVLEDEDTLTAYSRFPDFKGRIHWRAFQNRQYLQITPAGATRYQNGSFTVCAEDSDPKATQQLILSRTGRARLAQDNDGDGIRENSRGRPIRC